MIEQGIKGKNVLVTASTQDIGWETALLFVSLWAKVAIQGIIAQAEGDALSKKLEAAGAPKSAYYVGDMTQAEVAQNMVDAFAKDFGGVDVLVNNCGGLGPRNRLGEINEKDYNFCMDLNIKSMVFASNAAVPYLKKAGGGCVISISSNAGRVGGGLGASVYGGVKAFVAGVQRTWVKELSGDNIRFNAVSPGYIETAFHDDKSDEVKKSIVAQVPLQREGTPKDVANTIVFLASDMANYITGAIIDVTGGLTFTP